MSEMEKENKRVCYGGRQGTKRFTEEEIVNWIEGSREDQEAKGLENIHRNLATTGFIYLLAFVEQFQ